MKEFLTVRFCPRHFVCDILSGDILSGCLWVLLQPAASD